MRVNQSLVEEKGFDLIAMGRPEGSGCYCAANNLLTASLDSLSDNYKYIVVDNEAGMEHISRITTKKVDMLFVVSDPSKRSLTAASRIKELAQEMGVLTGPCYLVLSMVRKNPPQPLLDSVKEMGLELAGILPDDEDLAAQDLAGEPTSRLPLDNPVVKGAFDIFENTVSTQ
jgi:CO dehydrogenase maturation factor